jgi:hypothetical protein
VFWSVAGGMSRSFASRFSQFRIEVHDIGVGIPGHDVAAADAKLLVLLPLIPTSHRRRQTL